MAKGFTVNVKQQHPVSLYKIQEQDTTGWNDITQSLSKEECSKEYNFHISQGTPPERLKIIRVQ